MPRRPRLTTTLDLQTLRDDLTRAGAFERHPARTWAKLALLLSGAALAVGLPLAFAPWLTWALLPLTALFVTAAVMIGHEGGHKSFAAGPMQNELLLHLAFPLLGGLSAAYWKNKHNVKHHGHPNIDGVDDDLRIWPMAGTRHHHEASGAFRRFLQRRLQGWLFWPLSSLLTVSMRSSSLAFLVRSARAGRFDGAWVLDAGCLALHYAGWLVLPSLVWGFGTAVAFYLALWGIIGVYLTAIFAPAHMGLPIYREHPDTWRLQLETTRNLRLPRWLGFFFIGLDHQVEHHLFMRMPHQKMRLASPIVRRWAEARGLPYQEIGFFRGLVEVTRFVKHAWRHEPTVAPGPLPVPVRHAA